jgi:hypothetical protein
VVVSDSIFLLPVFVVPNVLGLVHAVSSAKMAAVGILAFAKVAFESTLVSKICRPLTMCTKAYVGRNTDRKRYQRRVSMHICGDIIELTAVDVFAVPVLTG